MNKQQQIIIIIGVIGVALLIGVVLGLAPALMNNTETRQYATTTESTQSPQSRSDVRVVFECRAYCGIPYSTLSSEGGNN
jgi:hypothetical protein